jgi:hypothetical protein
VNEEYHEHCAVVEYLLRQYPDTLLTIAPNGIKLTMMQAVRFKRMGYSAGTPDILIFEPKGKWHGLLIEMKREKGGQVSEHQKEWLQKANDRRYYAVVCKGFTEAKNMIDDYMNGVAI